MKHCSNCNQYSGDLATFCGNCGQKFEEKNSMPSEITSSIGKDFNEDSSKKAIQPQKKSFIAVGIAAIAVIAAIILAVSIFVNKTLSTEGSVNAASVQKKQVQDQNNGQESKKQTGIKKGGEPEGIEQASAPEKTDITHLAGVSVSCRSLPNSSTGISYGPEQLIDGDLSSAWVEGLTDKGNYGIGESLTLSFEERVAVTSLKILPGYFKEGPDQNGRSWDRWWTNGRLKRVKIEADNGLSLEHTFDDTRGWQEVVFPKEVEVNSIKVTILSVYPAVKDDAGRSASDTSVSEIKVFGWVK